MDEGKTNGRTDVRLSMTENIFVSKCMVLDTSYTTQDPTSPIGPSVCHIHFFMFFSYPYALVT